MSRLAVDPDGLTALAMTALSLARDTETCQAEFRCGAAGLAADRFVLMSLDTRFEAVIARLSGLARSLILVADAFARTEATLAASMVLPYRHRFVATRTLVAAEVVRLAVEVAGLSGSQRSRAQRRLDRYDELLTGRVRLVRPDGTVTSQPHQLLVFDPRGDGRIVEVFGDLTRATHVAVYVPGTGTSLDRYDGNAERASSFAAAAPDLAVVLWQNADFPDQPQDDLVPPASLWDRPIRALESQLRGHVFAAAYRDAADVAGAALARDVAALRALAPGPTSDLTVLGHSYGGSIVGSAEVHGLRADRIVHIASAGAYVDDVDDYAAGECGTRRFSMTAADDPIQLAQGAGFGSVGEARHSVRTVAGVLPLPLKPFTLAVTAGLLATSSDPFQVGHGRDPDLIPGVTRLDTGLRADGRTLVSGHSGMFEPGSGGWRNLLAVMRGDPVQVFEPARWHADLVPVGTSLPHYEVTRSPYDRAGYEPPTTSSTGPLCSRPQSW
ncbi:MAG: alpha/beta hydrolase [Actinomycetales bacterium]